MDLGLSLKDSTLQLLAKMPLRSSVKLLEAGKEARKQLEAKNHKQSISRTWRLIDLGSIRGFSLPALGVTCDGHAEGTL